MAIDLVVGSFLGHMYPSVELFAMISATSYVSGTSPSAGRRQNV